MDTTGQGTNSSRPLVLVTGSGGLIGSRVREALSSAYRVVGLELEPSHPDDLPCDLTDDASVVRAIEKVRDDHGHEVASVVHLAAHYDFSGEPSPLYEQLTVVGTRRLLERLAPLEVEQFVFSSSLLVMEPVSPGEVVTESSPTCAEWEYPQSKLDAEAVIRRHARGLSTVILRIAGVYDEDGHSLPIAQQMRRIHEESLESRFFPGNPENGQSFVHLDDLARCFRAVVDRRGELDPQDLFLIGEPDVVGYAEMQDLLGKAIHGKRWPAIRVPRTLAKAGAWLKEKFPGSDPFIKPWMIDLADAHLPVSIEHAAVRLGWKPEHRLRDVLPEMGRRLVEDPESWYRENGLDMPASVAGSRDEAVASGRGR